MIRINRDRKSALEFEGWEIAHVSTRRPVRLRWTELTLYAVESDVSDTLWVLEVVGKSAVDGDVDLRDATPCVDVDDLVKALSKNGELTAPGRALLEMAAYQDDELSQFASNEEKVERL